MEYTPSIDMSSNEVHDLPQILFGEGRFLLISGAVILFVLFVLGKIDSDVKVAIFGTFEPCFGFFVRGSFGEIENGPEHGDIEGYGTPVVADVGYERWEFGSGFLVGRSSCVYN
jgi:hypothetical protein